MSAFITALTGENGISAATFYGVLTDLVPFIVIMVTVSLGFYFIRKMLKGTRKARLEM